VIFQDYNFHDVREREFLLTMYRKGKKVKMDFDKYNDIKEQIHQTRYDLQRLRDPLQLQLPIEQIKKMRDINADPPTQ
jgi:hypothetical protein